MTQFETTRARIVDYKSRLNPATGQPYSLAEIARLVGLRSGQAVHYYTRELKNRCPGCLRALKTSPRDRQNR
jgi:hypothetical protein